MKSHELDIYYEPGKTFKLGGVEYLVAEDVDDGRCDRCVGGIDNSLCYSLPPCTFVIFILKTTPSYSFPPELFEI